jgi:hypothetical protein
MTPAEVIQLIAAIVSALVIADSLLKQVREWRGGSPELRLLRQSIESVQKNHTSLLKRILEKLP